MPELWLGQIKDNWPGRVGTWKDPTSLLNDSGITFVGRNMR
jgi:hypothetical protein